MLFALGRPRLSLNGGWLLVLSAVACFGVEPPAALESGDVPTPNLQSGGEPAAPRDGAGASSDPALGPLPEAADARGVAPNATDGFTDGLTDGAAVVRPGCLKIDFLFVVDNSQSMGDEQWNLARSFPGFMRIIASKLQAADVHVMVVDTDALEPDALDTPTQSAPTHEAGCDATLGAGRRANHEGLDCGLAPGERFITAAQADLASTFSCLGKVGTSGSSEERPAAALLGATSRELSGVYGCNASFLREDAVLVVTILTDEDDTYSSGTPETWRRELLGVKNGDESALVVLALVGDENRAEPLSGGPCSAQDARGAPLLQEFVSGFRHGFLGAVCARNYAPFFAEAVDVIADACETFVPPQIY